VSDVIVTGSLDVLVTTTVKLKVPPGASWLSGSAVFSTVMVGSTSVMVTMASSLSVAVSLSSSTTTTVTMSVWLAPP
jgi:hypothetical protein